MFDASLLRDINIGVLIDDWGYILGQTDNTWTPRIEYNTYVTSSFASYKNFNLKYDPKFIYNGYIYLLFSVQNTVGYGGIATKNNSNNQHSTVMYNPNNFTLGRPISDWTSAGRWYYINSIGIFNIGMSILVDN